MLNIPFRLHLSPISPSKITWHEKNHVNKHFRNHPGHHDDHHWHHRGRHCYHHHVLWVTLPSDPSPKLSLRISSFFASNFWRGMIMTISLTLSIIDDHHDQFDSIIVQFKRSVYSLIKWAAKLELSNKRGWGPTKSDERLNWQPRPTRALIVGIFSDIISGSFLIFALLNCG